MVSNVSPKARATPANPMPRLGKAAARTALPQPPSTSQNVPKNSAPQRFPSDMRGLLSWSSVSAAHRGAAEPLVDVLPSAPEYHTGVLSSQDLGCWQFTTGSRLGRRRKVQRGGRTWVFEAEADLHRGVFRENDLLSARK